MAWRLADPDRCFDRWAEDKVEQQRLLMLNGLAELADCPLTELPGLSSQGRSPMRRWVIIESTFVVIHVYESVGCFDLVDLRDL